MSFAIPRRGIVLQKAMNLPERSRKFRAFLCGMLGRVVPLSVNALPFVLQFFVHRITPFFPIRARDSVCELPIRESRRYDDD
jgi:hypothetical protein